MQFIKRSLYICALLLEWARCSPSSRELKLESVQIAFRHGDRTPERFEMQLLPGGTDALAEPWGYAQLTNAGKQRMYAFGKLLRARYQDLLGESYRPGDVLARSSSYDRTQSSLQLVLAGLYPPTGELVWSEELAWMPIPIHAVPFELDGLFFMSHCPKLIDDWTQLMGSAGIKRALRRYDKLFELLGDVYPEYTVTLELLFDLNNLLSSHGSSSVPLPDWYSPTIRAQLRSAAKFYLDTLSYTPGLVRLNGGPMAQRFLDNARLGEPNSHGRKIYFYSGHEFTVYALAKAHGLTLDQPPSYGSALILEKLRSPEGHCVKMFFWSGEAMRQLQLADCADCCPLGEYARIVNASLPTARERHCLYEHLRPGDLEKYLLDA